MHIPSQQLARISLLKPGTAEDWRDQRKKVPTKGMISSRFGARKTFLNHLLKNEREKSQGLSYFLLNISGTAES